MNRYPLLPYPAARGQTLMELMVTLAVTSILLANAAPNFTSLRFSHALTTQANEMLGTLNFARSEAIRRNRPVMLCRTAGELSAACVSASGTWQYWMVLAGSSVVRRGAIPSNGLTQTSTLTADTVTFGADGLARTNNTLVNKQYVEIDAPLGAAAEDTRRVVLGAGSRTSVSKVSRGQENGH